MMSQSLVVIHNSQLRRNRSCLREVMCPLVSPLIPTSPKVSASRSDAYPSEDSHVDTGVSTTQAGVNVTVSYLYFLSDQPTIYV
jgi:hypothetical protein